MQTARMVQAVGLMLIVAIAASCAASKEYTSKLFAPRIPATADSQATAKTLRFLDLDHVEPNKENWVNTDIIMGRDTVSKTLALDNFSKVYPASSSTPAVDSTAKSTPVKPTEVVATKPVPVESEPVARYVNPGEVRTKKTRE